MNFQYSQDPEALLRRIKFRKRFPLLSVLDLVVGVDCDRMNPKPVPKCFIQDSILHGIVGYSVPEKRLSYLGRYPVPVLGNFELYANYDFSAGSQRRYNVGFRLGSSGLVQMMQKKETDFNFKVPFNRRLGFEVHGNVKRPSVGVETGSGGGLRVGSGALAINLAEANAIVYV